MGQRPAPMPGQRPAWLRPLSVPSYTHPLESGWGVAGPPRPGSPAPATLQPLRGCWPLDQDLALLPKDDPSTVLGLGHGHPAGVRGGNKPLEVVIHNKKLPEARSAWGNSGSPSREPEQLPPLPCHAAAAAGNADRHSHHHHDRTRSDSIRCVPCQRNMCAYNKNSSIGIDSQTLV